MGVSMLARKYDIGKFAFLDANLFPNISLNFKIRILRENFYSYPIKTIILNNFILH